MNLDDLVPTDQESNQSGIANLNIKEIKQLFWSIADKQTKKIDFSIFLGVGLDRSILLSEDNLRKIFDIIDRNQEGYFTKEDLEHAYLARKGNLNGEESKEDWDLLFNEGDLDGDGVINFKEFKNAMLKGIIYMSSFANRGAIEESKAEDSVSTAITSVQLFTKQ